jgi:hypothetical protein
VFLCVFKGTRVWDILKCLFGPTKNIMWPLSIFLKMLRIFFQFLPEFWCLNIFAMTEQTQNQLFVAKKFFVNIHFGPVMFLVGFWKFSFFEVKISFYLVFTVLFQKFLHALTESMWNSFSHTVSTLKRFHRWLSQHWTNFFPCLGSN